MKFADIVIYILLFFFSWISLFEVSFSRFVYCRNDSKWLDFYIKTLHNFTTRWNFPKKFLGLEDSWRHNYPANFIKKTWRV